MWRSVGSVIMVVMVVSCTTAPSPRSSTTPVLTSGSVQETEEVTSTTADIAISSTLADGPVVEENGWRGVPHDEVVLGGRGDQVVTAMAASPFSIVAVGSEPSVAGESIAISWVSADGSSWSRNEQAVRDAEMDDVAWFPAGNTFVAVGHQVSEGAIWTSPDGTTWTRIALVPFENPAGGIEITSVANTAQGLVAVGSEWYGEGESIPAVWTSVEGQTWTRAEIDLSGTNTRRENGLVDAVAYEDDLFAVGFAWGGTSYEPRLWASIDGAKWRVIDLEEDDASESNLNAIAVGDDGTLVMVGESVAEHVDSRAWVSEDLGRTWSRVEVETAAVIPDLKDVAHTAVGWVAVGSAQHGEVIPAVWHKEDAGEWTRTSPRDQQFLPQEVTEFAGMTAVTSIDNVIVAGGFDGTDCGAPPEFAKCDLDAAFWIRTGDS